LDGTCGDELIPGVGETADRGRDGEQDQPGQEHATARQQVGDAPAEEEAAAGHHRVRGDDPLELAAVEAQRAADGR
jgi:hypothetical protein